MQNTREFSGLYYCLSIGCGLVSVNLHRGMKCWLRLEDKKSDIVDYATEMKIQTLVKAQQRHWAQDQCLHSRS